MTRVIATAGHVDHGKSRLVTALTGMEPDRLAEERRRGMTIDLGFAWTTLPSGVEVGFVDVPGHERFIATMLAGVGPVRLALFVVAADEGWARQSEEHLAICDAMGADGAVVALTKADLVDAGTLARRVGEVAERLRGTALAGSSIVACSSQDGTGLDELRRALDDLIARAPAPEDGGSPRLPIDRVFTIQGAGTVVTGTLIDGRLAVGDELVTLPRGIGMRVRALQTHRRSIDVAEPGSRVAVNVAGVERTDLRRGDTLAIAGARLAPTVVDVLLRPVRGHAIPSDRGAYAVHAATAERGTRLRILDAEHGFARLTLDAPLTLAVGDRFVLRDRGRSITVAGGTVLDVQPPARPGRDVASRLAARAAAGRDALPALLVRERRAIDRSALLPLVGSAPAAIDGATLLAERWWIADEASADVDRALTGALDHHHARHPADPGLTALAARDVVVAALRLGARASIDATAVADALITRSVAGGVVAREGAFVRLASHRASAGGREADLDGLVAAVLRGEPTPPTISELVAGGAARDLVDLAIREGRLVRISRDIVLSPGFVDRALASIRDAGPDGRSVSELREALGTSRKYAVPLVEHLDAIGATRREGDRRVARRSVTEGESTQI